MPLYEFDRIEDERVRAMIIRAIAPYIENIQKNELQTKGALMYDVLAAYYVLCPDAFIVKHVPITVNIENGIASETFDGDMVTVAAGVSENGFVDYFIKSINQ